MKQIEEASGGSPDPLGRWVLSKQNLREVITRKIKLPESVIIYDDTLRSGANMPYVSLDIETKLEIARKLEEIGVRDAKVGYASVEEHVDFIKRLTDEGTSMRLFANVRSYITNWSDDIDRAVESGVNGVWFAVRRPGVAIPGRKPMNEKEYRERISDCVAYAKERGLFVVGPSIKEGLEAGINRVVVPDGRGWLLPETIEFETMAMRDFVGPNVEISVHCHNDYGLATANTLAALKGGADALEVTVNGYGHRSGNAPFEQVVLACEALYGVQTGIKINMLYDLCKYVEERFGMPIAPHHPFVGKHAYCHGGLHIPPLLQTPPQWYRWENIKAESIGVTRSYIWHTPALQLGRHGPIAEKIRSMDLNFSDEQLKEIIDKTSELIKKNKWASDEELVEIIREVIPS